MTDAGVTGAIAAKQRALAVWLEQTGSLLVAFSGGVDSALLAVAATDALGASRVLAVLGVSASVPAAVHVRARRLADDFGVALREVETHELDDADYVANRGNRCFFCKQELWRRLTPIARAEGLAVIADGAIADDARDHRPGRAAGVAAHISSPLAACGFTKADVRAAARARGIPIWNAPASPCLASRIAVGVDVSADRLASIDRAESALRALGITGDLRVRDLGDAARVELPPESVHEWLGATQRARVARSVRAAGFARVLLDVQGYRRGALQDASPAAVIDITSDTPTGSAA